MGYIIANIYKPYMIYADSPVGMHIPNDPWS